MSDDALVPLLLRAWESTLGGDAAWSPLSDRNFVYRIIAPGGAYILKMTGRVNPSGSDPARKLAAEYDLLLYLKNSGVPVAVPQAADDGQHYCKHEDRFYALTPALPHAPGAEDDLGRVFRSTGAAIARLHRALAAYTGPIYSWTMDLPPRILNDMAPIIASRVDLEERARFNTVIEAVRAPLTEHLNGLPSQYIHGDCHGGNILHVGEEVSGFIDLDHLPFGPRIYDLCYRLTDEGKQLVSHPPTSERWFEDIVPSLFSGYEQEISLTTGEKDAVPYMMMGICLIFTGWLFEHNILPQIAQDNLSMFFWLFEHRDRVRTSIR